MPRRRVRRFLLGVLLSIIVIAGVLGYAAWRLSWQQPAWYAPPNARDAKVQAIADDAEYDLLQQTQQMRPADERWTLRLSAAQINAWLASRLPAWIEHDANLTWPERIGTPQVLIDEAGVQLAAPLTIGPDSDAARSAVSRVLVVTLEPSIEVDGRLALPMTSLSLGKVWIPGRPLTRLVDAVRDASPEFLEHPQVRQALAVLAGEESLPAEYLLGDGRRIRIVGVRLAHGAIELQAVTLP